MHSSAKKHDYSTANIIGSYYSGVTVSEEKVNLEEVRGDRGGKQDTIRQCDFQVAQKKKQLLNECVFIHRACFSSRLTSSILQL